MSPVAVALLLSAFAPPQDPPRPLPEPVEVFTAGERGYHTFRIPAVVRTNDGALLAFAEGRVNGSGDSGDIDIVLKRSTDGGASWGPLQVVADNGPGVFGNPTPVVERESGDVVLLCVRQPEDCHENQIRGSVKGSRDPWVLRSSDGGRIWSGPQPAGPQADRPDWRWYATGPCHAIQLKNGPHAGRLVAPANFSVAGGPENSYLGAHLLLSDDGGRTWRIGAVDASHVGENTINPSETAVAELDNGWLYANTRDQHGESPETRAGTWSEDGGASFNAAFAPIRGLEGPVCQGALLDAGIHEGRETLLFSGPSDPGARKRLALRVSFGGGFDWKEARLLYPGAAAYSDLVALEPGRFGCLFEADGYGRIVFQPFGFEHLDLRPL